MDTNEVVKYLIVKNILYKIGLKDWIKRYKL